MSGPLTQAFPRPGPQVSRAYTELAKAQDGTDEEKAALGNPSDLPRPWIPSTCTRPELRLELWNWFEAAVAWINHEHYFSPDRMIPPCWPQHPHLVHEVAVLVDLRLRAETSLDSGPLEEWHRYALPGFVERMSRQIGTHCSNGHVKRTPNGSRFEAYLRAEVATPRARAFAGDVEALAKSKKAVGGTGGTGGAEEPSAPTGRPRLRLVDDRVVDESSGEVLD